MVYDSLLHVLDREPRGGLVAGRLKVAVCLISLCVPYFTSKCISAGSLVVGVAVAAVLVEFHETQIPAKFKG